MVELVIVGRLIRGKETAMADPGFKPQKEINRIKVQVRKLEKDKDRMFPELGRLAYQEYLAGNVSDPAIEEACGRIKAIDAQVEEANANIAALQAQVQQMKAAPPPPVPGPAGVTCPACGAVAEPGVRFCGNCGAALPQQAPPAAAPASTCPSCGKPVATGARFCGSCGTSIAMPTAPAAPPAPPPAPAAPAPPPSVQAAPPPPPPPPTGAENPGESEAGARCPSCGAAAEEEGAAFCGECGARL